MRTVRLICIVILALCVGFNFGLHLGRRQLLQTQANFASLKDSFDSISASFNGMKSEYDKCMSRNETLLKALRYMPPGSIIDGGGADENPPVVTKGSKEKRK